MRKIIVLVSAGVHDSDYEPEDLAMRLKRAGVELFVVVSSIDQPREESINSLRKMASRPLVDHFFFVGGESPLDASDEAAASYDDRQVVFNSLDDHINAMVGGGSVCAFSAGRHFITFDGNAFTHQARRQICLGADN